MPRPSPVARVRARLVSEGLGSIAAALPDGYQRIGSVLFVRLPEPIRANYAAIGAAYQDEFRATSVLAATGPISGEWRVPSTRRIAGDSSETEVREHGIRYRLDAERIMFSAGNKSERARAGTVTRPGETVVDLFAGIGYFALPAAKFGRAARVIAVEAHPVSFRYLTENIARNGVERIVEPVFGDNREVPLPARSADRVFLGYLPSALPWVGRAIGLLRPSGGWLHVHRVVGSRQTPDEVGADVRGAVARSGSAPQEVAFREVKPYGPGRRHVVTDVRVIPG